MSQQTVIPIEVDDGASFQSFHSGRNRILIEQLEQLVNHRRDAKVIYIWGEPGSGKTHLLDACCRAAERIGVPGLYVSLAQASGHLQQLAAINPDTLVCIDDLEHIVGLSDAEKRLFNLYERVINAGGGLVASGSAPLQSIKLGLKDLESRLSSGGTYQLLALDDEEKRAALKLNAKNRGFSLDDNVVAYIMTHLSRDVNSLFALMDKLDAASLREQRKITIPFIKALL